MHANVAREEFNNFLLDGVDNNDAYVNRYVVQPSVDGIAHQSVQGIGIRWSKDTVSWHLACASNQSRGGAFAQSQTRAALQDCARRPKRLLEFGTEHPDAAPCPAGSEMQR